MSQNFDMYTIERKNAMKEKLRGNLMFFINFVTVYSKKSAFLSGYGRLCNINIFAQAVTSFTRLV